jgi:signal transduction histidine kinase
VTEALDSAERATAELRELAHGILPGALAHGGLRAGVGALASRMPVPVEIDVSVGRLPTAVEATAYFFVAEALTNVAKHARARQAKVTARIDDGTLAVHVRDDGMGGARPDESGLVGLADRLASLDGQLRVESPTNGDTLIAAAIPIGGSAPSREARPALRERSKRVARRTPTSLGHSGRTARQARTHTRPIPIIRRHDQRAVALGAKAPAL